MKIGILLIGLGGEFVTMGTYEFIYMLHVHDTFSALLSGVRVLIGIIVLRVGIIRYRKFTSKKTINAK